jgi:hypothetical protein
VHQHEKDQPKRDKHLDNGEDCFHASSVTPFARKRARRCTFRPIRPSSVAPPRAHVQFRRFAAMRVYTPLLSSNPRLDPDVDYESFTHVCFPADMNRVRGRPVALGVLLEYDHRTRSR